MSSSITTSTIYEYSSRRRRQLQLPESSDIDRVHHALVATGVSKRDVTDGRYYLDYEHRALPRHLGTATTTTTAASTVSLLPWQKSSHNQSAYNSRFQNFSRALTSSITTTATGSRRRLTSINLEDYFEFQLQLLPTTGSVTVYPLLYYTDCDDSDAISASVSSSSCFATPGIFTFTSESTNAGKGRFVIRCTSGCYAVRLMTVSANGGNTYNNVTEPVRVIKTTNAPPPPKLTKVALSSDGTKMLMSFNLPTDKAETSVADYLSTFTCSDLLDFNASDSSSCRFYNSTYLIATFPSDTSITRVEAGETVTILDNTIKSECIVGGDVIQSVCDANEYATTGLSMELAVPDDPITPNVVLSASKTVSACDNLVLDATQTSGKGSTNWAGHSWTIRMVDDDGNDVDIVPGSTIDNRFYSFSYAVNSIGTNIAEPQAIPSSFLEEGATYEITLELTNSVGVKGSGVALITVSTSAATPIVTIPGQPSRVTYRDAAISLFANASITQSTCTGVDSPELDYTWKIYKDLVLDSSLVSTSKDIRFMKLPAYSLDAGSDYLFQVLVSVPSPSGDGTSIGWSYASTTVLVGAAGVDAVISGGRTNFQCNREEYCHQWCSEYRY